MFRIKTQSTSRTDAVRTCIMCVYCKIRLQILQWQYCIRWYRTIFSTIYAFADSKTRKIMHPKRVEHILECKHKKNHKIRLRCGLQNGHSETLVHVKGRINNLWINQLIDKQTGECLLVESSSRVVSVRCWSTR